MTTLAQKWYCLRNLMNIKLSIYLSIYLSNVPMLLVQYWGNFYVENSYLSYQAQLTLPFSVEEKGNVSLLPCFSSA